MGLKKLKGILGFPSTRLRRIGVEQETDVGFGRQLHNKLHIGLHELRLQVQIGKFVIDVTVEDDNICV